MAFTFDTTLAREVYPLAFLVGRWRGAGVISYAGIERQRVLYNIEFSHDGEPYLRYEATLSKLPSEFRRVGERVDLSAPDADFAPPTSNEFAAATVWTTETGYWRPSTETIVGLGDGQFAIEVLLADALGRLTAYLGWIGKGRAELASQKMVRTATAPDVTASVRQYGLVQGRLFVSEDIAGYGQPLGSYLAAQLSRVEPDSHISDIPDAQS